MSHEMLDMNGKLKEPYLPAIYFDSSILIDYWISETLEWPEDENTEELLRIGHPEDFLLRQLFIKDKRIKDTFKIRDKILSGNSNLTAITTSLSLIELMEWHTEAVFKEYATESLGSMFIQKKGKKEISNFLNELLIEANEIKREELFNETKDWKVEALKRLMGDLWLNRSFVNHHGLLGISQIDIKNFDFKIDKAWQESSALAYLQMGGVLIYYISFLQNI